MIAIFQLADGTLRKLVLLQEPKKLTPTQIAIIVGILVAIILLICGCCIVCNREKIFKKRNNASTTAESDAPVPAGAAYPKQDNPQYTYGTNDSGMPLMPVPSAGAPPVQVWITKLKLFVNGASVLLTVYKCVDCNL